MWGDGVVGDGAVVGVGWWAMGCDGAVGDGVVMGMGWWVWGGG